MSGAETGAEGAKGAGAAGGTSIEHGEHGEIRRRDIATALRNMALLGGSLFGTWTVALVIRFWIPRFLGTVTFGEFNFADNFAAAVFMFTALGVDTYIQKEIPIRPAHASDFFGGIVLARLVMSALSFCVAAGVIVLTGRSKTLESVVVLFGVAQVFVTFNQTLAVFLQSATKVGKLALMNVGSKLVWGLGVAAALLFHAPLPVLVLPLIGSEILKSAVLFPIVRREMSLRITVDLTWTKKVLVASAPFYLNAIVLSLGGKIDVILLEFLCPGDEVGWYSAAGSLAGLSTLLSPLIGWVLMPLMTRANARSADEFFAIFRRSLEGLVLTAIPVTLFAALGADLWVRLAFSSKHGDNFAPAAASLRVLAPMFVFSYAAVLASNALIIRNRGWLVTWISLANLIVQPILTLFTVPYFKQLGPGGAGIGAGAPFVTTEVLATVVSVALLGKDGVDGRFLRKVGASVLAVLATIALDRAAAPWGDVRIVPEIALFLVLVVAFRAVDVREALGIVKMVAARRRSPAPSS